GAHLERLAEVRVVAFDKTGTLTRGEPRVNDVIAVDGEQPSHVLRYAAAVEARSEHALARAISHRASELGLEVPAARGFMSTPGRGAEARVDERHVIVGNDALLAARGIAVPPESMEALRQRGATVVCVAVDGQLLGFIAVADPLRDTARETIEMLRLHGVRRVAMLTGDHAVTARAVAADLALDDNHPGLMPDEKHDRILAMRSDGAVLMVGDGVNDAPALAAADVGVAMGAAASDAALETADVALMSGELLKLPYALRLARATVRNIKTNLVVSLALKAIFLVTAMTGSATLWMAVLADTGASVIVVANALRLLRAR
ncbi:MAG TPA: HAD-IC family P-type ATPase, partial [Vicinamibacterales bacterium]|nr:HAD-IC family P-type ATPase [Vicinamibacterales bacterium]